MNLSFMRSELINKRKEKKKKNTPCARGFVLFLNNLGGRGMFVGGWIFQVATYAQKRSW